MFGRVVLDLEEDLVSYGLTTGVSRNFDAWRELLELGLPVGQGGGRNNNQVGPRPPAPPRRRAIRLVSGLVIRLAEGLVARLVIRLVAGPVVARDEMAKERDNLARLAEAHVVGQDAAEPVLV